MARNVDPIEGVHALCGLTHDRSDELNDIATFFSVVSSETEHFPTGDWRLNCDPNYLKKVDLERELYLKEVLPEIDQACHKLIEQLPHSELAKAAHAEQQNKLVEAADAYEVIISTHTKPPLDVFINLMLLYFEAQDHGTQVEQNIPIDYVSHAYSRMKSLFEQAKKLYPESVELDFWKNYIFLLYPYGPAYERVDPEFFQQNKEVIPYFLAYKPLTGEHSEQAQQIWELVKHGHTFKERYIRHFIKDGILGRFTG